jgi:two-component system, OmpR family, sensor histidine kinase ChvG
VSLRVKLLLLGLLTLALPWAGCQYAREMESVLREGERQSLLAVAQTIAASLQGREALLYRSPHSAPSASPHPPVARAATPEALDFEPLPLVGEPLLDGFPDDWPQAPSAWRSFTARSGDRLRVLTGIHGHFLFVLIEVRDAHVVYEAPGADPLDPASYGDRIWIGCDDAAGDTHAYLIAVFGPGPVRAKRIEAREYGREVAIDEPRIEGAWSAMQGGYRVELHVPLSMIGERFGVLLDDRAARGAAAETIGNLGSSDLRPLGHLLAPAPELEPYLRQFAQPGVGLAVASVSGAVLANVDALPLATDLGPGRGALQQLYRQFLDRGSTKLREPATEFGRLGSEAVSGALSGVPDTRIERGDDERRLVVAALVPIFDGARARIIGVVQAAQSADRWLLLRDRALTRLFNLTLIASSLTVLATFSFAAWLAWRLARLKAASEGALGREGRLTTQFPETGTRDELGDLARSFSRLLGRLEEYTGYLRTLAGKLAHEIRTPLTIVRSSLENLESETLPAAAQTYVARAREGSERLKAILQAMGAATRVEEAIGSSERVKFDVAALVASTVAAYAEAFAPHRILAQVPAAPCLIRGAPELIVQLLDKLVENAVDFSTPGSTILVRAVREEHAARIEVENAGPLLPGEFRGRVFESLWQSRTAADSRPHFGLGLYIVRLIAQFHGGSAAADNLPDESGVRFTVRVPL